VHQHGFAADYAGSFALELEQYTIDIIGNKVPRTLFYEPCRI
jgi:hypothetical protein